MKAKKLCCLLPLLAGLTACDDFSLRPETETGELRWVLDKGTLTKTSGEIPDTNDFLLSIRDAEGKTLYEGAYGDSPQYLPVVPGSYTIGIVSIPFKAPAFSRPQYGDEQVAVVPSGGKVTVKLQCTLRNAGIRLRISSGFLNAFPGGTLYLKQDGSRLEYGYAENRIAYLFPDDVALTLSDEGKEQTLFTRRLQPREILSLNLSAPSPASGTSGTVEVAVDTSKNWTSDHLEIGGDPSGEGNGPDGWQQAISVAEAASRSGENGVWVYGYIVGGDLTSAGKNVRTKGITKNTHIALADRSSVTDKSSCLAVELPKGSVRDALNLVDNPALKGKRVYVKGNVVNSYFGTTGLKGVKEYRLP